ncbi:arabinan endo-1,5-alpha-L-arabinosidase [Paenibacillus psychroresistens]|uniref:Arabinan endo-1,5-alpha-L-arabinosidase n=1 Tax=Paenibacillus psychroresistens TaxID=1778678 RepID=A0A6B8RG83_9BACL|nr:family 43 glycosylhydrolase [Paenibacillus psychroresistens]QGQ94522.1 arabinan endo-1,5-alpha-L-arabinosidase [Paenibacillus psychroresistens]
MKKSKKSLYTLTTVIALIALTVLAWPIINESYLHNYKNAYTNPVFEPVLADPAILRGADGFFYAYGTEDEWKTGEKSKLVPIVKSADLVKWNYVGDAFTTKPDWKKDGGIWAPDISFDNGSYYLYYSLSDWGDSNPAIGVAISANPAGPFEDKGKLFDSTQVSVRNSIDPMLFVDEDGTKYLIWGSFNGIYGITLSADGLSIQGEKFQIAGSDFEGPYIIKRGAYYYFFGSIGSCCAGKDSMYLVSVGRSESLKGPYLDADGNDIIESPGTVILIGEDLDKDNNKTKNFVGPGHNSIIQDDSGTDWIVYHAIDSSNPLLPNEATRRPLMIDPIVWVDGWPTIKNQVPSKVKSPGPVWNKP